MSDNDTSALCNGSGPYPHWPSPSMTHPSPEAVAKAMDYAVVVARDMKRRAARGTHPDMPSETCIDTLAAHVTALTTQLEAERAKVSELADERDSFAGELDEANENLDFIRDIEGALKAETARETARADAAVAEVKALREENDTLRGIVATSALDCVYCGLPASRMAECASGFPGCGRADDIAARATLAQPAADGGK